MSSLSPPLRPVDLARQLEGQMMRWGRDVSSPHGNLLLRYGFIRFRTTDHTGSSRYRLCWRDRLIELHSSCVTVCGGGRAGLRYVRSRQRVYLFTASEPPPPGDSPEDLLIQPFGPVEIALFRSAAGELRQWLRAYSAWRARISGGLTTDRSDGQSLVRWLRGLWRTSRPLFSMSARGANRAPDVPGPVVLQRSRFG